MEGAGTLALTADMKQMKPDFVRGVSLAGYGVSLALGIGVPIPILNAQILKRAAVRDRDIYAPVVDYSTDYPERTGKILGRVSYAELKSGQIVLNGKKIDVGSMSSYAKALEIAALLRDQIARGEFLLSAPVRRLPPRQGLKPLNVVPRPGAPARRASGADRKPARDGRKARDSSTEKPK
jgi:uncharacterized protein (DUF39 family)